MILKVKINNEWLHVLEADKKKLVCVKFVERYNYKEIEQLTIKDLRIHKLFEVTEIEYCNYEQAYIKDFDVRKKVLDIINND